MKSSLKSLLFLAVGLAMSCAAVVASAAEYTIKAATYGCHALKEFALTVFIGPTLNTEDTGKAASMVGFVKERSFHQRQIKRERPVVTPTWRACPSI